MRVTASISPRKKRERAASVRQAARDVRFVSVDFTRDRLEDALASTGHVDLLSVAVYRRGEMTDHANESDHAMAADG